MALITNKQLNQLLVDLEFIQGEATEKNNRFWHHASGTTLVLPNNKVLESATQADLLTVGGHLDNGGHLSQDEFSAFVAEGKLVAVN